ncbi:MAG: hypothetical protein LLG20_04750 [Acidobacteriales bacterium]|nr:hypothetical protein [Terriglobales bacterium]
MSGQEVVRELRLRAATRRTLAAYLTAMQESDLRALGRRTGGAGKEQLISKPLTTGHVRALLLKLKSSSRGAGPAPRSAVENQFEYARAGLCQES